MKKRSYRAQKVNEVRWEEVADRVKERTVVWAIDVAKVEESVGRVSAPTHSAKSAPSSDSMLLPQFAGSHPCSTYRWKLEYGQWLTCANVPMLHRVPMDVIDMPVEVGLIADEMFPESMLP